MGGHAREHTDADEAGLKSPHLVHSGFQGAEALAEGAGEGIALGLGLALLGRQKAL